MSVTRRYPNRLKLLRRMRGKTQIELAEEFNVAVATISRHESGSRGLDRQMINAYAEYYNVKPFELFIGSSRLTAKKR